MRALAVACVALLPIATCDAQTLLGPLHYLSIADSPLSIGDPSFVLENFEDDLFNVIGVTSNLDNQSVIGPGGLTDSVDADDGAIDGSGTFGHSLSGFGLQGAHFIFDAAILGGLPTEVGIVWTDGGGETTFYAFDADNTLIGAIGPVAIATPMFNGQTDEDHFFGITHAAGVKRIHIFNGVRGIEVDHFQFSFAGACTPSADVNGDRVIDGADLGLLLGSWGSCPPTGCCDADLNGDGAIDGADLGLMLGSWGD